jgi:phage shock protein A|tara:strand:- start:33 stop:197 length:165 start_codon:yes stop_codon:yes gene_type:complete
MLLQQLQRLQQDSKQLEHYIHRLNKQGNKALACNMIKKAEFLNQHIANIQQTIQ